MEHEPGLPVLTGTDVTLRPLRREDMRAALALLAQPRVREWWGPYDAGRFERDFFEPAWTFTYLVLVDDEIAGLVQFHEVPDPDYRSAAIDITLGDEFQDRGLGTDALRTIVRYLIRVRGHHRLTMDPAAANSRAIHVYEKVGFRPVGVMRRYERTVSGRWRDGLLMDLLADEFEDA